MKVATGPPVRKKMTESPNFGKAGDYSLSLSRTTQESQAQSLKIRGSREF